MAALWLWSGRAERVSAEEPRVQGQGPWAVRVRSSACPSTRILGSRETLLSAAALLDPPTSEGGRAASGAVVSPALTLGLDSASPQAALSLGLVEVATVFVELLRPVDLKRQFRDGALVPVLRGYPAATQLLFTQGPAAAVLPEPSGQPGKRGWGTWDPAPLLPCLAVALDKALPLRAPGAPSSWEEGACPFLQGHCERAFPGPSLSRQTAARTSCLLSPQTMWPGIPSWELTAQRGHQTYSLLEYRPATSSPLRSSLTGSSFAAENTCRVIFWRLKNSHQKALPPHPPF